jgi:putative pyruvate formate lyase activating enzyme
MMTEPGYVHLVETGKLAERAEAAWAMLAACELCPHRCGANRLAGERGYCRSDATLRVASWNVHPWEEPPISGTRGSGTIFLSGCTARCRFCQNYPISQLGYGKDVSLRELGDMLLWLQDKKHVHNINFVTPTHFTAHILAALPTAIQRGLRLPLVWNTSGYERPEILQLLEGVVDVWLPDAKYASNATARRLSGYTDYVGANRAALQEIHRQVGSDLVVDEAGLARRGMIVRHLVLPADLAGTREVLGWLAQNLSPCVHVSLMAQYFPAHRVLGDPVLGRKLTLQEYETALEAFDDIGLERGFVQDLCADAWEVDASVIPG